MAQLIVRTQDFGNASKITNLPDPTAAQDAATKAYVDSAIEGLNWKDSARVATQSNINLSAPGSTIDGITMATSDRFMARVQTTAADNGMYVWNGAATTATRTADMNSAAEVEQAVVTVEEGTSAGVTYRQTAVNVTLGSTSLAWTTFGTSVSAASETVSGTAELATQAETDAGTDDARIVTPLKLATSPWAKKKVGADFGDGTNTSYTITHNFATYDVDVNVFRTSGNRDTVQPEVQRSSTNAVVVIFDTAVTSNQFRAVISA